MRKIWPFIWHPKKGLLSVAPWGWECDRHKGLKVILKYLVFSLLQDLFLRLCVQIWFCFKFDVIKQNESELTNTVFNILANKANSFFSYPLCNHLTVCIFGTNCPISIGFLQIFNNALIENTKNWKSYFLTLDSFCLI